MMEKGVEVRQEHVLLHADVDQSTVGWTLSSIVRTSWPA